LAKKKIEKPKREVTKRQLSHWQQQKRRQRIIFGLGIFVIVAVLGIAGAGWYIKQYRPLHQTVISVNDTEFNMDYYIKMLKFYGEGQPSYYMYSLAGEVVTVIEQNELVKQGAMKLGISVSNKAVDEELKSRNLPVSKEHRDLARTGMLANKLRDEHFEQEVPVLAEQRHIMAMFLESNSQATEVKTRLGTGEDFAELADELSLDGFSKTNKGALDWRPRGVLTTLLGTPILEEYIFDCEVGILSQPIYDEAKTKSIGYWIIKILDRKQEPEETHIQAILLGSEQEAQDVLARLDAGEDFAALAEELSQHLATKENGGDFGLLTPGIMSPAFDEFIFDADVKLETLSEPVRDEATMTKGGYWLLKVLDKEDDKEISDDDRDLLKTNALNEWFSRLWADPENEVNSYLTNETRQWAIEKATGS